MSDCKEELVKISRALGKDPLLVLGTFGNTSVKTSDGKFMYIKASGSALKDMTRTKGWRRLQLDAVRDILQNESISAAEPQNRLRLMTKSLLSACDDKYRRVTSKPSVESCFHSILGRYVIHLHPAAPLAYACAKDGRVQVSSLFRKADVPPVWIPYANPGFELAKKIKRGLESRKTKFDTEPQVLVLQNHGLVVSAGSSEQAVALVRKVVDTCGQAFNKVRRMTVRPPCSRPVARAGSVIKDVLPDFNKGSFSVCHFYNRNIAAVLAGKNVTRICSGSAVTPDELIYAGGPALYLEKINTEKLANLLEKRLRQNKRLPKAFLVKSTGLFIAEQKNKIGFVREVVEMYLGVRGFSQRLGGIHPLSKSSCDFIIRNYV